MNYSESPYAPQQQSYYQTSQQTTSTYTPPNPIEEREARYQQEHQAQEQEYQEEEEYFDDEESFNHFMWIIPLALLLLLSAGYLFYHFKIKDRATVASTTEVAKNQGENNSIAATSDTDDSYTDTRTEELKEEVDYYSSSPYESLEDESSSGTTYAENSSTEDEGNDTASFYDDTHTSNETDSYTSDAHSVAATTTDASTHSSVNHNITSSHTNHDTGAIYSKYDLPKGYYAILNAFSEKTNALNYVRQMPTQNGTPYVVNSGGTYKTTVFLSNNEREAESKLETIRQYVKPDAWMLRNN